MLATLDTTRFRDLDNNGDKLPVVELRPFTTKQWLPSKSRPTYGQVRAQTSLGISSTSSTARGTPRTSTNGPCPRAFSVTGERVSKHPPIRDVKNDAWKADNPTPAFVNKMEREKTTLEDIKSGRNVCSQYSCLKRSLTELDISQQQDIKVKGKKVEKLPPKLSNLYCEPWQHYHSNTKSNQMLVDTLYMRIENLQNVYLDENIYDPFDRERTLPSIHVRQAKMAEKVQTPRPQENNQQGAGGYRLGVTNTLDVMRNYGRPLCVEHQLSSELKQTLHHLRRTKDNIQLVGNTKGLPVRMESGQLTPGEASLYTKFSQNTPKVGSPTKSSKSQLSGSTEASYQRQDSFPKVTPTKEGGLLSSVNQAWVPADSLPTHPPGTKAQTLTQAEFKQQHRTKSPSVLEAPLEVDEEEKTQELTIHSASQEVLTIPTDEASMTQSSQGAGYNSKVFLTDTKDEQRNGQSKMDIQPNSEAVCDTQTLEQSTKDSEAQEVATIEDDSVTMDPDEQSEQQ